MKPLKKITLIAILTALYVVFSMTIKINFIGHITLDLGYIVLTVAAYCLGGIPAMCVGAIGCAIESILLTPLGFSISWVTMNIIVGLTVGLICYRLKDKAIWFGIPVIIAAVFVGIIAKTGIECALYQIPLAVKIPKALVAFGVDSAVMIMAIPLVPRLRNLLSKKKNG